MATQATLERYARLIVEVGLNLQPGQLLAIGCLLEHAPLARAVAERAYAGGARFVDVLYTDQHVRRSHIAHAPASDLGWSPPWLVARLEELERAGGALLSIGGNPDPDLLAGLDGKRVAASRMAAVAETSIRLSNGGCNWSVVAFPTEGWSRAVFGAPDVERLWAAVTTAVRLDEADPVAAWREHIAALNERAARLNEREFETLHYWGPGTDLSIGLLRDSIWRAAVGESRGIIHVPNMPTEEVFTTPDARRVDGVVAATYPLLLQGAVVRELRVRFKDGRAVEISAEEGETLVRAHLATDEGAARLGEIALVDRSSRVATTGLVFHDTLFDENAASHLAFGSAILHSVRAPAGELEAAARHARGINNSSVHTDFMIGSPSLAVDGITSGGDAVPVMRDGAFILE